MKNGRIGGRWWTTAVMLCCLVSCKHAAVTVQDNGGFPDRISGIVNANCLGGDCHSSATRLNDSLDLSGWRATFLTGRIAEIIPYRPLNSHLFQHLNTNLSIDASADPIMPLGRDPLSLSDQKTIYDWIAAGAPSSTGEIYYDRVPDQLVTIHHDQDLLSVMDQSNDRVARIFVIGNDPATGVSPLGARAVAVSRTALYVSYANGTLRYYDTASYSQQGTASYPVAAALGFTTQGAKGYLLAAGSPDPHTIITFAAGALHAIDTITSDAIRGAASIVMSPTSPLAYVVCSGSDDIKLIDTTADTIVGNICCGADVPQPLPATYIPRYAPHQAAITSDGTRMYVSLQSTREVLEIDLASRTILRRIQVGYKPYGICITHDAKETWVVNQNSSSVSVIDNTSNTVVATIDSLSNTPEDIVESNDHAKMYVSCEYLASGGHHHSSGGGPPAGVFVLDRAAHKLRGTIELPPYATSLLVP